MKLLSTLKAGNVIKANKVQNPRAQVRPTSVSATVAMTTTDNRDIAGNVLEQNASGSIGKGSVLIQCYK